MNKIAQSNQFGVPGSDTFTGPGARSGIELVNPLGTYNFQFILDRIIDGLLILAAPIVTIMVLYAAYLLITSAGNPEKVSRAWKTITYAAIGYGVILLSKGISYLVAQLLYEF